MICFHAGMIIHLMISRSFSPCLRSYRLLLFSRVFLLLLLLYYYDFLLNKKIYLNKDWLNFEILFR